MTCLSSGRQLLEVKDFDINFPGFASHSASSGFWGKSQIGIVFSLRKAGMKKIFPNWQFFFKPITSWSRRPILE